MGATVSFLTTIHLMSLPSFFSISGHFLDRCQLLYWMLTVFLGLTASRWWVISAEAAVWAVGVVCFIWVWACPIWYFCGVFVGLLPTPESWVVFGCPCSI